MTTRAEGAEHAVSPAPLRAIPATPPAGWARDLTDAQRLVILEAFRRDAYEATIANAAGERNR